MKIWIGVHRSVPFDSGWWRVLEQEKLPFRSVEDGEAPVTVFEESTPAWLNDYVEAGGTAVVVGARSDRVDFRTDWRGEYQVDAVHTHLAGVGTIAAPALAHVFAGEGFGEIRVHGNRLTKGNVVNGRYPAFVVEGIGKGWIVYTGLPLSRLVSYIGDAMRVFYTLGRLTERVASADKQKIISLMVWSLREAFRLARLPYVHLWYYPDDAESVFTFRIDGDGLFGDSFTGLIEAADAARIPLTIYLNKSLCESDSSLVAAVGGFHSIGNHADVHNLYDSKEENQRNVESCTRWLSDLRVQHGPWYAAPRGMWNFNLGLSLEELGFEFSSDFGYDVDALPFFPRQGTRRLNVMQVPIHPYSVEREVIFSEEQNLPLPTPDSVLSYFVETRSRLRSAYLPANFYSHPQHFGKMARYVFPRLANEVREDSKTLIWTLPQLASWWRMRDSLEIDCEYNEKSRELRVSIDTHGREPGDDAPSVNVVGEGDTATTAVLDGTTSLDVVRKNRFEGVSKASGGRR